MLEVIREEEYRISNWSGGKTKELYLWPENGSYAERNFQVRISSATVELPESDFTYLEGVERYLKDLDGEMVLTVNGGEPVDMKDGRILHFSGEDQVHCVGCATDFNLMLKGTTGRMLALKPGECLQLKKDREYFLYGAEGFTAKIAETCAVRQGESLHLKDEDGILVVDGFAGELPVAEFYVSGCQKD